LGAKDIGAHAKVDYSSIENPPNVGPGKEFTLRQKQDQTMQRIQQQRAISQRRQEI
ncbi:hypothetical protein YA0848_35710, partial [Pseudomonas sp. S4_EA_1b]|nr:hypothetical protein [Pseudomonas sp. S4_EA_1b]